MYASVPVIPVSLTPLVSVALMADEVTDSEVTKQNSRAVCHENIIRLDIPMYYTLRVYVCNCFGNLSEYWYDFGFACQIAWIFGSKLVFWRLGGWDRPESRIPWRWLGNGWLACFSWMNDSLYLGILGWLRFLSIVTSLTICTRFAFVICLMSQDLRR